MFGYKTFDPSNLSRFKQKALLMKGEELITPESNHENINKFFENLDYYCSILQNSEGDITDFHKVFDSIHDLGNIYQSEKIIPIMIQSRLFYSILDSFNIYPYCILSILIDMVNCSYENLLLLLQNNLMSILFDGIRSEDHAICHKSFLCLSMILSQNYKSIEDIIITSLIVSTNIIELIYNILTENNFHFNISIINSFLFFFDSFFEHLPPDSIRTSENHEKSSIFFNKFLDECIEKQCFNKDRFEDFIFNGISLSEDSIYYKIIHKSLSYATHFKNINIITNFCWIVFYLLKRDITTYETFFSNLNFLAYASEWMNMPNPKIFYEALSLIIAQLFYESSSIIHLPQEDVEQLYSMSLHIFNYSSTINDDDFEKKTVCALGNSIIFNEASFSIDLLNNDIRNRIITKATQSSFRLSRYYCYLALAIASLVDDAFLFLNSDILEKIFDFLDKGEGNFVESSLSSFGQIFFKEYQRGENEFKTLFLNLGGEDLLINLMDSPNPSISKKAQLIYDQYVIIKPGQINDE